MGSSSDAFWVVGFNTIRNKENAVIANLDPFSMAIGNTDSLFCPEQKIHGDIFPCFIGIDPGLLFKQSTFDLT